MVAISLYRGNLHRVPELPRRWLSPSPKISLKNFRLLLCRRSSALSRRRSPAASNPNPNNLNSNQEGPKSESPEIDTDLSQPEEEPVRITNGVDDGPMNQIVVYEPVPRAARINGDVLDTGGNSVCEKPPETTDVVEALSETEIKKKEIEEKLEVLNAKKHDLVQVLKQILNAEEELKRRSSTQSLGTRPSIPLQVDVTNDSGSLSRLTTPRLNSDGNLAADIERGEADDTSHQNTHSRHLGRPSSISPSSDSLHRRPAFSTVPHPRASLGGVGSPSRFAPVGHHPTAVSTSGTSYIASSPSPAASGSTSTFRDNRQPSPWN